MKTLVVLLTWGRFFSIFLFMIKVENLSKYYSGHKAVDALSFTIREGEIVGLLGLNGAGKSTILKMLGSFLLPSAGRAQIGGYYVDQNPEAVREIIGYLPDTPPLYGEMRIQSYLEFVARLKNVPKDQVSNSVNRVAGFTNITDVMDMRLRELSHGYRQRVGIAQALVHNPRVLILDEPINGLDPVQIVEMRDLITSLRGKHTVILSSHILSEITKTCDRILIIDKGKLVAEGGEGELAKRMSRNMLLRCEIDHCDDRLLQNLRALPGIIKVEALSGTSSFPQLKIETEGDIRKNISSAVVNQNIGLLGLSREEAGLEGLFMKLVRSQSTQEGKHG